MNMRESGARPNGTATLTYGNKRIELPAYKAHRSGRMRSIPPQALWRGADLLLPMIRGSLQQHPAESDITFIDGDAV